MRARWIVLALYLALLLVSHLVRHPVLDRACPVEGDRVVAVPAVGGEGTVEIAYRDRGPREAPTLLLLHGSPGGQRDFDGLVRHLGDSLRVITLDLPGFGRSQRRVADYSIAAHADAALHLLDALGVERAHLLGFSMGGGVALEMIGRRPERVASLTMLSAIGVQELELLGSYELNHLLHGAQRVGLWLLHEAVPHMGRLDDVALDRSYARNFYDSDQRPLRGILRRVEAPALILHGRRDPLVPLAAAREHHRLLPQSRLVELEGGHFLLWRQPARLAERWRDFVAEVESGRAPTRAQADARRRAEAARPPGTQPRAHGLALILLLGLLVLGTFVSEDLTCISAGLLVAGGRLDLFVALGACFAGIFFGDLLLYALGRRLGRSLLHRRPWRWWLPPERLDAAARWFERRGMAVILLSRFLPGTRLATYVACGMVRARLAPFAAYFFVAVALWTPLLVGAAVLVGREALPLLHRFQRATLVGFMLTALLTLLLLRLLLPLGSHRGRRRLRARLCRIRRWEFWPLGLFYLPVGLHLIGRSLRHRGFAGVTAVNPGIPLGGFVGESKADILRRIEGPEIARWIRLGPGAIEERMAKGREFLDRHGFGYPVVLKPDVGERGRDVVIVRDEGRLREALLSLPAAALLQEYVGGVEVGVFYLRAPDAARGRIFSLTRKRLPELVGDGRRTLEQLVLDDDRAGCIAEVYLRANEDRLGWTPEDGERVRLVELGTHSRGAIFLDGSELITPALEEGVERISRRFEGFHFGRYDLRAPDEEAVRAGRDLRVLELNGLTSEATHIYDPRFSLWRAYGVLFEQWDWAFRIARANRERGARAATHRELLAAILLRREAQGA